MVSVRRFAVCAALGTALYPWAEARACGGTFCDAPTQPVNQASETVLFVQDGDTVEAHIQIAIELGTDAQSFAWVVPMPARPEFEVGSAPLFGRLLSSTVARRSLGETCESFGGGAGFISSPDGGPSSEPDIVDQQVVGAFEVTVLEGGSPGAVMAWLGDNGYTQDPEAEPILGEYLAEGNVLVAFKLVPSATVAEVHPVILRYPGDEPCVPIRLTRIAASEDMGVRAFFLGESRFVPTNYAHVVPNEAQMEWGAGRWRYDQWVTMAIDEAPGGRGFVTEYAGPADTVNTSGLWSDRWDASAFETIDPVDVVELIDEQGLSGCSRFIDCPGVNANLVEALRRYLPAPAEVSEAGFYGCVSCYAKEIDRQAWDGPGFAARVEERVIEPGRRSMELMQSWPVLTRLYTTISPHEMIEDPMFHQNPDLPNIEAQRIADVECLQECEDDALATLPSGRQVYLPGNAWPGFSQDMPWAERIEVVGPRGAPLVSIDNGGLIDQLLVQWNRAQQCSDEMTGSETTDGTSGSMPPSTAGGSSGSDRGDASPDAQQGDDDNASCTCRTSDRPSPWPTSLGLLVLVARRRTRRRP